MAERLKIVNLKCPNCGGVLEIHDDMERFTCAYCGSEQIVTRRGGTVALKLVVDAVARVQVGTDKTASELAIKRLILEIDNLEREWVALDQSKLEIEDSLFGLIGMRSSELKNVETKMETIMKVARKKNAELRQHQKTVEL